MFNRWSSPISIWITYLLWCVAVTLLAYGASLTLPFFFDDFVHLPFVDAHSLTEMWRTAGDLAYYRPLAFTIWKLMSLVMGGHSPLLHHAFSLMVHAANGFLVGWLAGHLWPGSPDTAGKPEANWPRVFLSGTLFLLYPFSYQAVPWVGSLAHLLATCLILLSLTTFWKWRQSGNRIWGAGSLVITFLAPFAHENGVLIGPLITAFHITSPQWRGNRGGAWQSTVKDAVCVGALWSLPTLIWFPIWWFVPKAVSEGLALTGGENLLQNTAYFIQALAYPLTWLGGRLRGWTGINDMAAVALLGGIALAGALLIQLKGKGSRRSLLPWFWAGLASLPAILFLAFDYVINGPRLAMLASVGAAWLWTDVAILAAGRVNRIESTCYPRARMRLGLVTALVLVILAQNIAFITNRMKLHMILGSAYQEAVTMVKEANGAGQKAILINLPAWLAPTEATYALGHEGVQFFPHYAHPDTLVSVNTGGPASVSLARYEAIRPEMPYLYGLSGSPPDWPSLGADGGRVAVVEYKPDRISITTAGTLSPPGTAAPPLARFDGPGDQGRIFLAEANIGKREGGLDVTLTWRVEETPADHITAFVHLIDAEGRLIAQSDGDPLAGSYPLSHWRPGTAVEEQRRIEDTDLGRTVLIGLYDRLTGDRLALMERADQLWSDNAVVLRVE